MFIRSQGFTLIELMIVVSIIGILMAVSIPAILRSRMNANEASAVMSVRIITTGEVGYQSAGVSSDPGSGLGQYGDLSALGGTDPPFIDSSLEIGLKSGYSFTVNIVTNASAPSFTITGAPTSTGSGLKTYWADQSGVIRFQNDGTPADSGSLPLN